MRPLARSGLSVKLMMDQCACWRGTEDELLARMQVAARWFDADYTRLMSEHVADLFTNGTDEGNPVGFYRPPTT